MKKGHKERNVAVSSPRHRLIGYQNSLVRRASGFTRRVACVLSSSFELTDIVIGLAFIF